jgi:hypothetical protein
VQLKQALQGQQVQSKSSATKQFAKLSMEEAIHIRISALKELLHAEKEQS